jgi:hypothetical protein
MRRRDFMTVLAGAAAYPLFAGAQQKPMPMIGILAAAAPDNARLKEASEPFFTDDFVVPSPLRGFNCGQPN